MLSAFLQDERSFAQGPSDVGVLERPTVAADFPCRVAEAFVAKHSMEPDGSPPYRAKSAAMGRKSIGIRRERCGETIIHNVQ